MSGFDKVVHSYEEAMAGLGDGMTVKRLRNVEGAWVFMSDNPEAGESWRDDQVRIVGRVYGRVDFEEIH